MYEESRPKRRYFGMSITQLAILGCLGVVALCSIGGVAWLILSTPSSSEVAAPTSETPFGLPSLTPSEILPPTATATIAPTPTSTPVPYESFIPDGWKQFRYSMIEIWLPPYWDGGDMVEGRSRTVAKIRALGEEYEQAAEDARDLPASVIFLAFDPTESPLMILASMTIHFDTVPSVNLDTYMDEFVSSYSQFPNNYVIMERKNVTMGLYQAGRVTYEYRGEGDTTMHLVYVVQIGDTFWHISYSAHINEYFDKLPVFEQSAPTFRVTP